MYFSMRIIDIEENWNTEGRSANIYRTGIYIYIYTYIRFPSIIYDITCLKILHENKINIL